MGEKDTVSQMCVSVGGAWARFTQGEVGANQLIIIRLAQMGMGEVTQLD